MDAQHKVLRSEESPYKKEKNTGGYLPTTHRTHKTRGTTTPATHAKENDTPYIILVGGK